MIHTAAYMLLSLLCLAVSIFCFGNLLASCSGHPPNTAIGIWIIPVSLFGGVAFLFLSLLLFKAKSLREQGRLKVETKLLPRKVIICLASFVVAAITYFLFMILMLELVIVTEGG